MLKHWEAVGGWEFLRNFVKRKTVSSALGTKEFHDDISQHLCDSIIGFPRPASRISSAASFCCFSSLIYLRLLVVFSPQVQSKAKLSHLIGWRATRSLLFQKDILTLPVPCTWKHFPENGKRDEGMFNVDMWLLLAFLVLHLLRFIFYRPDDKQWEGAREAKANKSQISSYERERWRTT